MPIFLLYILYSVFSGFYCILLYNLMKLSAVINGKMANAVNIKINENDIICK